MTESLLALVRSASLRTRLVVPLSAIIMLMVGGEVATSLSEKLDEFDRHVQNQGTVLAQGIAASCGDLVEGTNPHRFDEVISRVHESVDLVKLCIVNREGVIVGNTDPARIGQRVPAEQLQGMTLRRPPPSLLSVVRGYTEHQVRAPIMRGTQPLGHVTIVFRTDELREEAVHSLVAAAAAGTFWLVLGAFIASMYVRRITRPLATLTEAAGAFSRNELDRAELPESRDEDEVGVLQNAFRELVRDVREERARNQKLVTELRDLNDNLATRVEEVTADLRRAKAHLEDVLECVDEGILTLDAQLVVASANRGAVTQLEKLGRPTPGTALADLLPCGGEALLAAATAARDGATRRLELTCRGPGGTGPEDDRALAFHLSPLHSGQGAPGGVVMTVEDVTHERRVEGALRRHDRLISLGTLAAGLAHEMGNYMNSIQGYAALLLRAMKSEDANRADVQEIHDQNARAIALLERFKEFARPRDIREGPEDMDALVRESLVMAAYRLRKGQVRVVEELHLDGLQVRCDGQLLKQVFMNLVFNAVDAMDGRPDKVLTLRSRRLGDDVELEFQDNGAGIDPAHLEKIFDPFFTTKVATGTGLGLSIAHQVVEGHRGRIRVRSAPGQGATFSILLPIGGRNREVA